jgi:hypothetical protein
MPRLGLRKLREQTTAIMDGVRSRRSSSSTYLVTDHSIRYGPDGRYPMTDEMNRAEIGRISRAHNGDTSKRRRTLVRNFFRQYPHLRSASRAQLIAAFERREAGLPVVRPGDAKRAREAADKRRRKAAERTGAYVSEDLTKLSVKAREAYGMRDRFVKRTGIPL